MTHFLRIVYAVVSGVVAAALAANPDCVVPLSIALRSTGILP